MSTATTLPLTHFSTWLMVGERGISSEAIVSRLTGVPIVSNRWSSNHPRDPADFRRCQLLLEQVPLARLMFPAMRSESPEWARLVDHWDEIHEAILGEVPDYLGRWAKGAASNGYRLMQRVIADGVVCGTCNGSGQADACPKCKGSGRRGGGRCRAPRCHDGFDWCANCRGRGWHTVATS